MAELMTAVNELLKGKRVEENADIYCDGIETVCQIMYELSYFFGSIRRD